MGKAKYNKENDDRLYYLINQLNENIKERNSSSFYNTSSEILIYVFSIYATMEQIPIVVQNASRMMNRFNGKENKIDLNIFLNNENFTNSLKINFKPCEQIKENCKKASKLKGFDSEKILEHTDYIIDSIAKIYNSIYGDNAPEKSDLLDLINYKELENTNITSKLISKNEINSEKKILSEPKKVEKPVTIDDGFISLEEQLDATPRLPVCICLDLSGSMRGLKFEKLKEGLKLFCNAILEVPQSKRSAEIAIITFNDTYEVLRNFKRLEEPISLNGITPGYGTRLSPAINCALDLLEARKREYRHNGMEYYQPWLVILSDGLPGDDCEEVKQRVLALEEARKITVFSIPILSANENKEKKERTFNCMSGFTKNNVLPLDSEKIKEFFVWFSKSMHASIDRGETKLNSSTSEFLAKFK